MADRMTFSGIEPALLDVLDQDRLPGLEHADHHVAVARQGHPVSLDPLDQRGIGPRRVRVDEVLPRGVDEHEDRPVEMEDVDHGLHREVEELVDVPVGGEQARGPVDALQLVDLVPEIGVELGDFPELGLDQVLVPLDLRERVEEVALAREQALEESPGPRAGFPRAVELAELIAAEVAERLVDLRGRVAPDGRHRRVDALVVTADVLGEHAVRVPEEPQRHAPGPRVEHLDPLGRVELGVDLVHPLDDARDRHEGADEEALDVAEPPLRHRFEADPERGVVVLDDPARVFEQAHHHLARNPVVLVEEERGGVLELVVRRRQVLEDPARLLPPAAQDILVDGLAVDAADLGGRRCSLGRGRGHVYSIYRPRKP